MIAIVRAIPTLCIDTRIAAHIGFEMIETALRIRGGHPRNLFLRATRDRRENISKNSLGLGSLLKFLGDDPQLLFADSVGVFGARKPICGQRLSYNFFLNPQFCSN